MKRLIFVSFLFALPSVAQADIISGPTFVYYRYIAGNPILVALRVTALIAIVTLVVVKKRRTKRK